MRLLLIRHGRTEFTGRYCGSGSNPPLSEAGLREVKRLKRLLPFSPDVVFSSDLLRASQTAELLFNGKRIVYTPLLRELHFGEWEGRSHEELKCDKEYRRWLKEPFGRSPPRGEDPASFIRRVENFIGLLKTEEATRVGVVSHAGVIKSILSFFEERKIEDAFFNTRIGYAEFRICEVFF